MSRSGYTDDGDNAGYGLWRGRVSRVISSVRGQSFMRELVSALDAMPVKVLAREVFVEPDPYADDGDLEVCAMGAVALARGVDATGLTEADPDEVGAVLGIHSILAAEIAYANDEGGRHDETDEDRHARMRQWAADRVRAERPDTPRGTCAWCCRLFALRDGLINRHTFNRAPCPGSGQGARV